MPVDTKLIRVFVSSPSELISEREAVKKVISEINQGFIDRKIMLEYFGWDTSVTPGISSDPQNVINDQINNKYEIFLGFLWHRVGSPTPRMESGTIEEFYNAIERYKKNPNSVQILFYFCETPIPLKKIDVDQVRKLQEFRKKVEDEGVLYGTYQDITEFENLVRIHLTRLILKISNEISPEEQTPITKGKISNSNEENIPDNNEIYQNDNLGLLDYFELGTEKMNLSTEIQNKLNELMIDLGSKTRNRTAQLKAIKDKSKPQVARMILNESSNDLDYFSDQMEIEAPRLFQNFNLSIEYYGYGIIETSSLGVNGLTNLDIVLNSLNELAPNLENLSESMALLRDSIDSIPRLTNNLNLAKARAIRILNNFINELHSSHNQVISVIEITNEIKKDINQSS